MTGESRPARRALGRSLLEGRAMAADWAPTFDAVDRAAFLPDLMWPFDTRTHTATAVHRAEDPDAWYAAADRDAPIVTQWDDGAHTGTEPGRVSTSSSSMPSVVYALLQDLAVEDGMTVLDIGTGTGETAAALAHRCGSGNGGGVTTVEVDPAVSRQAGARLRAAGWDATVVVGDGAQGCADQAPYDRVLATVGVREIPGAWLQQTRPGGLIVAPWGTHFTHADAVARLTVHRGTATGRFTRPVEFMKARAQRLALPGHGAYAPTDGADASTTDVTEAEFVTGQYGALPFVLGLRVPRCVQVVAGKEDGARPVWFYGLGDRSWACVVFRDGADTARVWQAGERRLWDEVEGAYRWWTGQGAPGHGRFGLTVTPEGHRVWLDDPAAIVA
nr:methyltransferase domain-containing protein [Streptomyces sp. NBRC 110028]